MKMCFAYILHYYKVKTYKFDHLEKNNFLSYFFVYIYKTLPLRGHCGRDRVVDLKLHVQSVPITTKVASSNPDQVMCTRYNIM
jgi:hypothetical protein